MIKCTRIKDTNKERLEEEYRRLVDGKLSLRQLWKLLKPLLFIMEQGLRDANMNRSTDMVMANPILPDDILDEAIPVRLIIWYAARKIQLSTKHREIFEKPNILFRSWNDSWNTSKYLWFGFPGLLMLTLHSILTESLKSSTSSLRDTAVISNDFKGCYIYRTAAA